MPRSKSKSNTSNGASFKGQGITSFFRPIFLANRKLLKTRSNEQVLTMWLAANPGFKEVPENVKSGLAYLKSTMRSKGRKKKTALEVAAGTALAKSNNSQFLSTDAIDAGLEGLEMQIDECLTLARSLDRKGRLDSVIQALRIARRKVVWQLGEA